MIHDAMTSNFLISSATQGHSRLRRFNFFATYEVNYNEGVNPMVREHTVIEESKNIHVRFSLLILLLKSQKM